MKMKRNYLPKYNKILKSKCDLEPRQSTLELILGFAAAYECPKNKKRREVPLSGLVLN
jgi:hypothetical protein